MVNRILLPLLTGILLLACNNKKAGKADAETTAEPPPVAVARTVRDIEPALFTADSVQVLFYDNPDGDSLRYARYFTLAETADTAHVNLLLKEMNQVYVQEPKARPCRSEGKLYLLKGEAILKTVYFSTGSGSCRYFYFIKDGVFVYSTMTEAAAAWLKANRQKARKPKTAT